MRSEANFGFNFQDEGSEGETETGGAAVRKSSKTNKKKRKLEEDLAAGPPSKVSKIQQGKKSGRKGGKGLVDQPEKVRIPVAT